MVARKSPPAAEPKALQRAPAELLFKDELAALRADDTAPRPPGWLLSPRAVKRFVLGDLSAGLRPKFVASPSVLDRAMVSLATSRGLLLIGEPGTAKSWLSELLAAAISGTSTLTIQGSAATGEDQIKYGWNYALLLAEGPSERALVPGPVLTGMRQGKLVRFEEITRCPLEVQDGLLSMLSDRVLSIPELPGEDGVVFAREGFNIIATANTRDRGVNEMSAALKRRFNFETLHPISDLRAEVALVKREAEAQLRKSGVTLTLPEPVLDVLVTTFRDLRRGETAEGVAVERPTSVLSTAEAVSVAHAIGVRAHYLGDGSASVADVVECLAGAAVKESAEDLEKLRRYLELVAARRKEPHWVAFYEARARL
jgi:MoxR-like ATPase